MQGFLVQGFQRLLQRLESSCVLGIVCKVDVLRRIVLDIPSDVRTVADFRPDAAEGDSMCAKHH